MSEECQRGNTSEPLRAIERQQSPSGQQLLQLVVRQLFFSDLAMMRSLILFLVLALTQAWVPSSAPRALSTRTSLASSLKEKPSVKEASAEETTEKYGLEAGLFQSMKQNDGESAKSLLKKYGIAYLATSIPLAIVSFAICYVLVDNGVDVSGLLSKIGIQSDNAETAGTFAIAYAAHKAASPIRFPPTVLLTPVVAKLIGKEPNAEEDAA